MIFHNHHYSVDEGNFQNLNLMLQQFDKFQLISVFDYGRVFKLEGALYGIIFESLLTYYLTNMKNNFNFYQEKQRI